MHEVEVSFGDISLQCNDYEITSQINAMPKAIIRFSKKEFIKAGVISYLAEVNIKTIKTGRQLFKGNVVSVSHSAANAEIKLEGGVELQDTRHSGIAVTNVPAPELFYSFTRLAGIPNERIVVDGLDNSQKGYLAFIPIKGIKVKERKIFGEFEVIDLGHLKSKITPGSDKELWDGLLDGDSWLVIKVQATHFIDAEEIVLEEATSFLALYSAAMQFSYSSFNKKIIDWQRGRETQNLRRQPYVLLICLKGLGTWLRNLEPVVVADDDYDPQVQLDFHKALAHEHYEKLPILLWNRFRDSEDYYVVTLGFWQVLEVLCSKVKMPKRLTRAQATRLRNKIKPVVDDKEYILIEQAIDKANLHQLSDKLDQLLLDLKIELTQTERDLLGVFRKVRNDIEHGRKATTPTSQQVKEAKALVNRIMVEALTKT